MRAVWLALAVLVAAEVHAGMPAGNQPAQPQTAQVAQGVPVLPPASMGEVPPAAPCQGCGGGGGCHGGCLEKLKAFLCYRPICQGCRGHCCGHTPPLYTYLFDRPCLPAPMPCCPPQPKCGGCGGCASGC